MTPKKKPVYFGGKARTALPWKPLPFMEEYLDNLAADEKADRYIAAVRMGLLHFAIFAESEGIKHPEEIERKHILRFQVYLNELVDERSQMPLAASYRQQLMKYLRAWINWLLELGHITQTPWVRIRIGHTAKVPKPLEDDEIDALFEAHRRGAFTMSPFAFHRRETILVLLYGWGLRISELQSLTVTGMDMRLDFVTCRNKGGGIKVLPYSHEMKQVVQRWLVNRAKKAVPGEDSLLIDSYNGNQLSIQLIRQIITELGRSSGVPINPHRLRDSFGTKMLDEDVPVERIMKMLGHTRRSQTLAYSRLNDPKLKESHDAVMDPIIKRLTREDSYGTEIEEE